MSAPSPVHPSPAWQLRPADPANTAALTSALSCPAAIARLLAARSITAAELETFFHPALEHLHSPLLLLGMDRAVERIRAAVEHREPILIYGDYDVDGTTATVLLKTAIDRLSPPAEPSLVSWHVPHRIREGYGMQTQRLADAAATGVRLVVSVDTGVRAFAAAREARELGLDLIVTDHHLPDDAAGLPDALAVINPAQPGCPYPFKHLCGAAIAFKLAHALLLAQAHAGANQTAALQFLERRLLPSLLKLVAIATVADSVPLQGENRTITALGLRELANPVQPGLRALMQVAALPLDRAPSASDLGFRLGPRINAAGRMDVADDVIELFLTRSPDRAAELAQKLNQLNEDRRATERAALDTIEEHLLALLAEADDYPASCLVLDHPDWHRGVLGILASRVVERTGRPALVFSHQGDEAHGSGRSIHGFHLLDALSAAHTIPPEAAGPPLLTRFGGHAFAVGLTLPSAHLPTLRERLRCIGLGSEPAALLAPPLLCDAELAVTDLTVELADWLERCAPFGAGFPAPVFLARGLQLCSPVRLITERHICLQLAPAPHCPPLQALGWSRSTDWVARAQELALTPGVSVDLAFRLARKETRWFSGLELDLVALERS